MKQCVICGEKLPEEFQSFAECHPECAEVSTAEEIEEVELVEVNGKMYIKI